MKNSVISVVAGLAVIALVIIVLVSRAEQQSPSPETVHVVLASDAELVWRGKPWPKKGVIVAKTGEPTLKLGLEFSLTIDGDPLLDSDGKLLNVGIISRRKIPSAETTSGVDTIFASLNEDGKNREVPPWVLKQTEVIESKTTYEFSFF